MLQPCSSQPHQSPHLHGFPFPACPPLPPAALWLLQRLHCPPGLEEQPQPPAKRHLVASPSLLLLLLAQGRWHPQVASAQRGGTGVGSAAWYLLPAGCFSHSTWGGPACPPGAGGEQEPRTRTAQQHDTPAPRVLPVCAALSCVSSSTGAAKAIAQLDPGRLLSMLPPGSSPVLPL